MEFYSHKCRIVHITSKRLSITLPYTRYMQMNTETRVLEVDTSLNWNHINTVSKRPTSYVHPSTDNEPVPKESQGATLQRSLMEYATVMCDLLKEANIRTLEIVQR